MIREVIQAHVEGVAKKLGIDMPVILDFPAELAHGDYSTNIALTAAKALKLSPHEVAEKIVKEIGTIEGVTKIEIAGPGFINFHLAREAFVDVVKGIDERWGRNDHVKGYKVMVEYTDPNPFKQFHIGHLMSNAIGESISRLVDFSGAEVKRANYQGDVGPHVAKAIWGIQKLSLDAHHAADLGKAYAAGAEAYENDQKAKEEINIINAKVYDRPDTEINKIYDAGRSASLAHFEELYKVLGTKFDFYFFESETAPKGLAIVRAHPTVFEESDGAVVYKGEKVGLHTRVFITSRGLPTYEAKDLGLAEMKAEQWPFDLSISITATEQSGYFSVMLAAMKEVLPDIAKKIQHVSHGMMQLSGGKMSSRTGNVVTGESLIAEMRSQALGKMEGRELGDEKEKIADTVAVAAIKYSVLKQATGKNIIFDPEQSLSFEGDSGPYLQYAHTRALSVLAKAVEKAEAKNPPEQVPEFERLLPRFPDIVFRAAKENEPHYVTTYLTQLAGAFNSWYAAEKIIGTEHEEYKLALTKAFAQTMKNGLWLLGIQAPERM